MSFVCLQRKIFLIVTNVQTAHKKLFFCIFFQEIFWLYHLAKAVEIKKKIESEASDKYSYEYNSVLSIYFCHFFGSIASSLF
jgi:hypothetical protein